MDSSDDDALLTAREERRPDSTQQYSRRASPELRALEFGSQKYLEPSSCPDAGPITHFMRRDIAGKVRLGHLTETQFQRL